VELTAIGTVALAAATVVLVWYTVVSTRRDRADTEARAGRDRADAERRLREERELSEKRVREERTVAADIRRRNRRRADAAALIRRVSSLQPLLGSVPSLTLRERGDESPFPGGSSFNGPEDVQARESVELLRHGGWTEAAQLGTDDAAREAAVRYRQLVRLVDRATLGSLPPGHFRVVDSLSNYSTWVRMSLQALAENDTVPRLGSCEQEFPDLEAETTDAWKPGPEPPG
jgi:hypothetical protein